jgi:YHS domain-containing protein
MPSKNQFLAALALTVILSTGAYAAFAAQQTLCPVLGNPINPDLHADYNGKRIYFCCPPCVARFQQNPEAYLEKLNQMGQEPETVPGT